MVGILLLFFAIKFNSIKEIGEVYSFGDGSSSQLGILDQIEPTKKPQKIKALQGIKIEKIISGSLHNFAIDEKGLLYSWGNGDWSQHGHGIENDIFTPQILKEFLEDPVEMIAAGLSHTIVITKSNKILAFGSNKNGCLGIPPSKPWLRIKSVPVEIDLEPGETVTNIACGLFHSILTTNKSRIFGWGNNKLYSVGFPELGIISKPKELPEISGTMIKLLNCGSYHSIVVDYNDQIWVWGQGSDYQIGEQKNTFIQPVKFQSKLEGNIVKVSSGWSHTLILTNI